MISDKNKKIVFVGVSGGVDSSVAAALLKEAGFMVVGIFIKTWQPDFLDCTWRKERLDAIRVCTKLDIPFLMFNLEKEYKKMVADYMISEYKQGRTPNPDVMCNKYIKFGAFFDQAMKMGADFVATGHYAKKVEKSKIKNQKIKTQNQEFRLFAGDDTNKDQSYFLWTLTQKHLAKTFFPVGHLRKEEVRKLAKKYNLNTAEKKDSQGVCFLGKLDMKDFLKHFIKEKKGKVFLENGKEIGFHEGVVFYTLGERHGFVITEKGNSDKPYYVVKKDFQKNILYVSDQPAQIIDLEKKEIVINKTNWIAQFPEIGKKYQARLRYRQKLEDCEIISLNKDKAKIKFSKVQWSASSGQSLVLYNKDECLGGGIIT